MPLDNLITRFPNGVTNKFDNSAFANIKVPDRTIYHEFIEDFDRYTAAQWAVGGVNPVAPALVAGDGGLLSMATTGADNDSNYVQQLVSAWTLVAGKKLFFRVRATVDDATQSDLAFGLQIAVAGNNFLTPADGLFFRKDDDATSIVLVSRVGGVETVSASLGNIVDATQFEAMFAYDGQGNIVAGFNGAVRASITPAALTAVAMRVTAGVQAGSAAARTQLLDQVYCAKER